MDIDIDTPTTFKAKELFDVTRAAMVQDGEMIRHPCGMYFQNIAVDPYTGCAAIPYGDAEEHGYTKIDFLHLSALDAFENKDQIRTLLKANPQWGLLTDPNVVPKLFHVSKHLNTLRAIKPKSIQELADAIALIRPAKKHLIQAYANSANRQDLRAELYRKSDQYYFKRSHAVAYAHVIVLQLHLASAGLL